MYTETIRYAERNHDARISSTARLKGKLIRKHCRLFALNFARGREGSFPYSRDSDAVQLHPPGSPILQSVMWQCKRTSVMDVRTGQRVVTALLVAEDFSSTEIHRRLKGVQVEDAVGVRSIRRGVRHFVGGRPRRG
jgi:hypothetical protein